MWSTFDVIKTPISVDIHWTGGDIRQGIVTRTHPPGSVWSEHSLTKQDLVCGLGRCQQTDQALDITAALSSTSFNKEVLNLPYKLTVTNKSSLPKVQERF